ncbi:MAG TPA: GNAT family N-acetyltransferase [Steroidobacteraceae bacterium]|nr:GNAT family N-acetyltransferase [Steroidobacteraceae bacterium]
MTLPPAGFRPYEAADRDACLAIFDENCPEFFAPNERAGFSTFLERSADDYCVCVSNGRVAGGYGLILEGKGVMSLRWILVAKAAQRHGIGHVIMTRTINGAKKLKARLTIAASQKSAPFFTKFGAKEIKTTPDGWGPGMHRVEMELLP